MRDFTRAGFVGLVAFAAASGLNTLTRAADDKANDSKTNTKSETIRGVIAGVTLEGETAIDFASNCAETVATSFLTIVGSPMRDGMHDSANADRNKDNTDNDRDRTRTRTPGRTRAANGNATTSISSG